jgi:hypothetical protein
VVPPIVAAATSRHGSCASAKYRSLRYRCRCAAAPRGTPAESPGVSTAREG